MVTAGNPYGKQGDKSVVDLTTKMAIIGEEKIIDEYGVLYFGESIQKVLKQFWLRRIYECG